MFKFKYLIILVFISSCVDRSINKNKINWTSNQIRQYFEDSIAYREYNGQYGEGDSLNDFSIFSKHFLANIKSKIINDPNIFAFEEPYIDTAKKLPFKNWFRITVDPTFRIPYCLILEKKGKSSYLTCKMTDGYGGYYTGKLSFSLTQKFSEKLCDSINKELKKINFWNLKEDPTERGSDGETWIFESIYEGKYNLIERWVPQRFGTFETRKLAEIGLKLREESKLLEVLPYIDSITPRELDFQKKL